jgi:hypothetical protein
VRDKLLAHLHGAPARTQAQLRVLHMLPPWLGRRAFHRTRRSALVRKDPEAYRRAFRDVADDLAYLWPA